MSKNEMTQIIASWIVSAVDDNGWRTEITNDAGFNRSRFNQDYVTGLNFQQLNRLYVAIANRYGKISKDGGTKSAISSLMLHQTGSLIMNL